jgi:arylsulfatase A-like enzyme
MTAILLAISFGLCAGYLDVAIIVLKKFLWNPEGYYRSARDFPWSVPAGHAALMLVPGLLVAVVSRLRPRLVSLRAGSWLFATLAIWSALLRMPLYAACSLLMAAGLGRLIGEAVAVRVADRRRVRPVLAAIAGVLGALALVSSGRQAVAEYRAVGALPPPPRARNVVLIVWDTVRAYSLGLYGYSRDTTPNLAGWAQKGIVYRSTTAPAPWTYPSHACFFTGQWPMRINTQWKMTLDTPDPTLAEYLASRGYQTAGFVANTNSCTYESGLGRGFAHFEDYSLTPWSLLTRTVPGRWIAQKALRLAESYHLEKWVMLQSRDAGGINGAFLDWLGRRRPDRPFFAFLNYFDAHDSYVAPAEFLGRFGIRPRTQHDFEFIMDYLSFIKSTTPRRDVQMVRDCYEDCIAYLDDQLGRLLDELDHQGLLADTDVIITSDHGEAFGDHGILGHSYSVNLDEIGVPLVILSPDAPAGRRVFSPVSLRDLPATVVDRLGLSAGSPFPGRSLTAYWGLPPGRGSVEITTPAFSEQANRTAFRPEPGPGGVHPGFQMSIVSSDYHYIRDGTGGERLYDLRNDAIEAIDLMESTARRKEVEPLRRKLLEMLTDNPASVEVEEGYLKSYRESLKALVEQDSAGRVASDPRAVSDRLDRSRRPGS